MQTKIRYVVGTDFKTAMLCGLYETDAIAKMRANQSRNRMTNKIWRVELKVINKEQIQ